MKKLMTMIAAVGMAFGLFAGEVADEGFITGAAFEPNPNVTSDAMSWTKEGGFISTYWTNADGANVKTTEGVVSYGAECGVPSVFEFEKDTQYATINTTIGNPVELSYGESPAPIGNGLYFDAMVNMTVFDFGDEPTNSIPADAKIAVFLRLASNDDNAATNFVVYAGNKQMFVCSSDTKVSAGWHRLTVKAIKNVLTDGQMSAFVVFVDGRAVNCEEAEIKGANLTASASLFNKNAQLFKSLDPTATELAGVSFDGKGDVDDIVVTSTAPEFAEDPATATITWTPADFESLKIGGYTLDATELAKGSYILSLDDGQDTVNIAWTGAGTVMDNAGKDFGISDEAVDLTDKTAQAKATFGTEKFATVQEALDAANIAEASGTLKLLVDAKDIVIENTNGAMITLDLGGKNVSTTGSKAIRVSSDAVINNSLLTGSVTGKVSIDEEDVALTIENGTFNGAVDVSDGTLTINDGIFNGTVDATTINGGKFLVSANNDDGACTLTPPEGKIFVSDEATPAYWVLVDAVTVTFVDEKVTAPAAQKIAKGAKVTKPEDPSFAGWTFKGWFAPDAQAAFDFANTAIDADITLTAKWEEDVTFVATVTVDGTPTSYENVEAALAAVQAAEPTAETIVVAAIGEQTLTVSEGTITLADGKTITITPADKTWAFDAAFNGTVTLAVGATIKAYGIATGAVINVPAGYTLDAQGTDPTVYTAKLEITPVDPEEPIEGKTVEYVNDHLADYLKIPTGIVADDYLLLFHAVDAGEGKVKIELTEKATGELTDEVTTATEEIEVAGIAAGTEDSIEFMGTPGIWYQLNAAATLEGIEPVEEVQCGSDGAVTFSEKVAGAQGDTARFFKITASAVKKIK